jgi:hypothetical protein
MSESIESRCLLTDIGKQALKELLKKAYPNGCGSKKIGDYSPATIAKDLRDVDIHQTTVRNILISIDPSRQAIPGNLKKIGCLFKGLSTLEYVSRDEAWLIEYQRRYPNLIGYSPSIGQYFELALPKPKASVDRNKKIEQIANLLSILDYQDQESKFVGLLPAKAIAFSISAPSELTHQWLTNRLLRRVNHGGLMNCKLKVILLKPKDSASQIKTQLSKWTLADICNQIAISLKIKECDPNHIIQELVKYNTNQPVLIKVNSLQNELDRQILIQDFWQLVITQIDRLNNNSPHLSYTAKMSPLIMFVFESYVEKNNFNDNLALHHYLLNPLRIDIDHAQNWIVQEPVRKILLEERTLQAIEYLHEHQVSTWTCWQKAAHSDRLHLSIENLCRLFLIDCNLVDIAAHWKI